MKDALNMTYGFGCHCRNCEFCIKGTCEDEYWTCEKDILNPGSVHSKSFCSSGKPKENNTIDGFCDIADAIAKLRDDIKQAGATEGYFDVKLKNGKDLRVEINRWSEALEVAGLERSNRHIGDLDFIAMIQNDVESIGDIRIWKG